MTDTRKFWKVALEREESIRDAQEILSGLWELEIVEKEGWDFADRVWVHLNNQGIALGKVLDKNKTAVRKKDLVGL